MCCTCCLRCRHSVHRAASYHVPINRPTQRTHHSSTRTHANPPPTILPRCNRPHTVRTLVGATRKTHQTQHKHQVAPEDFDYTMNMINTTLTDFWPCCLCFTFGYVEEYRRTCPVVVCVSVCVCAHVCVCCVYAVCCQCCRVRVPV